MDMHTDVGAAPEPLFKPVKKRKFLRRRPDCETEDSQGETQPTNEESAYSDFPAVQHADDSTRPTHSIHLRRPHRARRGGLEFSASSRQVTGDGGQPTATEPAAEELDDEKIRVMSDRFTVHTGQTVDVDKHMMTYIESEMAKRYQRKPTDLPDSDTSHSNDTAGGRPTADISRREPASLGKLHEIDLGQETKLHNIARTKAATKKLTDDEVVPTDKDATPMGDPPGRDEKPWRNRKRQNSEAMERDRLVEEVLRESKLDVYDEPEEEVHSDGQAADDRIAEQFRRDFMDAIQSRRRLARVKPTKATKVEGPRGPKLGGSRSARAAMREMQEKSGQK